MLKTEYFAITKILSNLENFLNFLKNNFENFLFFRTLICCILAPNSSTLSRKSNGDTLSIHSSPGLPLKNKQKNGHQRTGSEPAVHSPRMATVTVTKGYSRQMVPVSELPKFGEFFCKM